MADREKLIELLDEAEEHSTDICVYNSDCKDCPGRKYGNKCREYLKADHLIANGVTVRERGRWIEGEMVIDDGVGGHIYHCSECGDWYHAFTPNYCPNCGADMRPMEEANV